MKNILKSLIVATLLLVVNSANAASTKAIDKNACETVYTNYYLLLEANSQEYFYNAKQDPFTLIHENRGTFVNNVWRTDFDADNVGYGVVNISTNTKLSSDKLARWTLNEYYTFRALASASANGNYIDGNNTYITNHTFESKNTNGTWTQRGYGLSLHPITTNEYINATYDASATITNVSPINYNTIDFTVYVKRSGFSNYGTNRTPIVNDNINWLFNPQVFYVQYCSPKVVEKTITYKSNAGSDVVTNMPSKQKFTSYRTTLSTKVPQRNGYTFIGWSKNSNASVNDDLYDIGAEYVGDSTTLYAIWKKNSDPIVGVYRISYVGNAAGVTNLPSDDVRYLNENTQISSLTPQLSGYTFLGWNTDAKAKTADAKFAPNAVITDRKDITLYAIWKKNEASVTPINNNQNNNDGKNITPGNPNNNSKNLLPENPNTGVEDYILPVGIVSLISLGGLALLKKKRTFIKF